MEVGEEGERDYHYTCGCTVTTSIDSCIKMGSDESHFNVSIIIRRDKVTRQSPQTTTVLKRKESRSGFEPRSLCVPA